ncbi:hypothetical protein [Paraburkholderia sp. SIMBA_054]|uniref:hypothetical protein n=1 Tax=Paraburkholderia sp. SIMBA_054 TaxID=3085795 RepID=UPI003979F8F3
MPKTFIEVDIRARARKARPIAKRRPFAPGRPLPFDPAYHELLADGTWHARIGVRARNRAALDEACRIVACGGTVAYIDPYAR